MIKAKNWSGKDLKGAWEVTIKIDGVRALLTEGVWLSRAGKPLYNLPEPDEDMAGDFEVYCGGFKETIERVRAKTKDRPISWNAFTRSILSTLGCGWRTCRTRRPTASRG